MTMIENARGGKVKDAAGQCLYDDIVSKIRRKQLSAGDPLPPVRTLVETYGISMRATLRAVERLGQEGWITRQHGSGNYIRQLQAVPGVPRIGLQADPQSFLTPVFHAITQALIEDGSFVVLDPAQVKDADGIDCMLYLGAQPESTDPLQIPRVVFMPYLPSYRVDVPAMDLVCGNYSKAAYNCGQFARKQGVESPILVHAYMNDATRLEDVERVRSFALGFRKSLSALTVLKGKAHTLSAGAGMVQELLNHSDASFVFCTSDDLAIGICHGLLAHGLRPGKRLQVMGLDGQPAGMNESFRLTTMELPLASIVQTIREVVRRRIRTPDAESWTIQVEMKLRQGDTAGTLESAC